MTSQLSFPGMEPQILVIQPIA